MATKKISALAELEVVAANDYVPIVDASTNTTKRVLLNSLLAPAYYVDSAESDQGATGSGRTLKDLVDTISTNEATIVFTNHGAASTTYTLTTSEIVPSNITLVFQNGAIIDGAGALTVYSPENIQAGKRQRIFGASLTASFTEPGLVYPHWWNDGVDDGTTTAQGAVQAAIDAVVAQSIIDFIYPKSYYNFTSFVTADKAIRMTCTSGVKADLQQATSNTNLIRVTASGVEIDTLKLTGPQSATEQTGELAVTAYGADKDNYISDLTIRNMEILTWGYMAVRMNFVQDFIIESNRINDIRYSMIHGLSVKQGAICKNILDTTIDTTQGYGVALTRVFSDSITTDPRSADVVVSGNVALNIPWSCYDTHGGERISFEGNLAYNCGGIGVNPADDASANADFAPLDVSVTDNILDSGVTDGSRPQGISFVGAADGSGDDRYATGIIRGNVLRGYGREATATDSAILAYWTYGLVVDNNTMYRCSCAGIRIYYQNHGFVCTNNTVVDPWSDTNTAYGIFTDGVSNLGLIAHNALKLGSLTGKSSILATGIFLANSADNVIRLGPNYSDAATYLNDAGQKAMVGLVGTAVTSGTGEDDLQSQVIPADITAPATVNYQIMGVGQRIKVTAAGIKTGANGNKTIKFYFGATSVTFNAAANDVTDWRFEAIIEYSTTGPVQRITWAGWNGTTITQGYDTAAETMTADVTMKITGECAHASDVITQTMWVVEWL